MTDSPGVPDGDIESKPRAPGPLTPAAAAERMRRRSAGVDEAIRRAEAEGAFRNLPGSGKPLQWRDDLAAGDMSLAFHMLANAGYTPDWIARSKQLRDEMADLASQVNAFVQWCQEQSRALDRDEAPADSRDRGALRAAAAARSERLHAQHTALNDRIDRYNLIAPFATARLPRLALDATLQRALERAGAASAA